VSDSGCSLAIARSRRLRRRPNGFRGAVRHRLLVTGVVLAACSGSEVRQSERAAAADPASFDAGRWVSVDAGAVSGGPQATARGRDEAAVPDGGSTASDAAAPVANRTDPPATLPDAGVELTSPMEPLESATPETRCTTDADCSIFNEDCGSYCGTCPEFGVAVNAFGRRKAKRQCRRERRQWLKRHGSSRKRVRCAACRGGFPSAECRRGVCTKVVADEKVRPFGDDPLPGLSERSGAPLSADQVKGVMVSARAPLSSCLQEHAPGEKGKGLVARIRVEPEGKVGAVSVRTDNRQLHTCVRKAIMPLQFPKAENRTSFSWPLR